MPVGVRATWWYTVAGLVLLDVLVLGNWWVRVGEEPAHATTPATPWLVLLGTLLQAGAATVLVLDYPAGAGHDGEEAADRARRRRRTGAAFAAGTAGAVLLGVTAGSWMLGAGLLGFLLCLRPWPPGVRWRLVVVVTAVLAGLWVVDAPGLAVADPDRTDLATMPPTMLLILPGLSAFSLWWWDVVRELDRARETAGALSATRERLRLAGEVHDLQGHHLQVVALQLELAERLIDRDPAAAAEQIRVARASVDEARAGTRDLATRFRGVPLPDELANAADLLRAAGHDVHVALGPGVADAPADVLGPLVRESVTNVLKHGAVGRSRIGLHRTPGHWVYVIANPRRPASSPEAPTPAGTAGGGPGTGLAAMRDRVGALGGTVHVGDGDDFELTVRVPVGTTGTAGAAGTAGSAQDGGRA